MRGPDRLVRLAMTCRVEARIRSLSSFGVRDGKIRKDRSDTRISNEFVSDNTKPDGRIPEYSPKRPGILGGPAFAGGGTGGLATGVYKVFVFAVSTSSPNHCKFVFVSSNELRQSVRRRSDDVCDREH